MSLISQVVSVIEQSETVWMNISKRLPFIRAQIAFVLSFFPSFPGSRWWGVSNN